MKKIQCLAFGAHPDDVELFCSGLLIKLQRQGYTTGIIDMTRGELSTNGTILLREIEAKKAAEILKVKFRKNLEFEDGNIEYTLANRMHVITQIREYCPDIVLVPYWDDRHPDHEAASRLISDACYYSGLQKIESNHDSYRPKAILYYMMHRVFRPTFIVDISKEMDKKIKAIEEYSSQFGEESKNKNETFINRPEFFDSIINRAKFYGYEINSNYGEPYYCKRAIKLNNIMDVFS